MAASVAALALVPSVASGAQPGPDLLYAPPVDAPQLQNAGPWKAQPILVSGATAYRDGEFLYQDFLFDDHGAAGSVPDPTDPFNQAFAPKRGTLTYPTDAAFANNGADLVELRVKPLADATALRVTFNTLKAPERTAFTVALGDSPAPLAWPHGAGVRSPAALFLTVHGDQAELLDAATGRAVAPSPTAAVDRARRQVEVRVPHAAWDPGTSTVRMTSGAGLWDPQAGGYLKPTLAASATQPGGAGESGAALFNVAFRVSEPVPKVSQPPIGNSIVEGTAGARIDASWWRERQQADALGSGDLTGFGAQVDFGKLRRGVDDESGVPRTGHIDRIFASRFALGDGVDHSVSCDASQAQLTGGAPSKCTGPYLSQLQPYAEYVPAKGTPARGYGLVLAMHGATANYNEFLGSNFATQLGERGDGSIVASPEGRGPMGGYASYAEADVFEVWADVARHHDLNPAMTDVTGYSMGGIGSFRLAARWPDLFARAAPIVGPLPTTAFTSLRHIPVMAWYGQNDELGSPALSEPTFLGAQQAGIRYDHWVFAPAGHITLANNDEFAPIAEFFGDHEAVRDPARVTYTTDPRETAPPLSVADHAYWVSGLTPRSPDAKASIDVRSHGFGVGDPPVQAPALSAGTLNGGSHGPLPYTRRTIDWGPAPAAPKDDRLDVGATNVRSVTIDVRRARVSCNPKVELTSDGPADVLLTGCPSALPARRSCVDRRKFTFRLHHMRGARVVAVDVFVNGRRKLRKRGRRIEKVTLRRLPQRRFKVKIVATQSGGAKLTSTRTYSGCRKSRPVSAMT